MAVCGCRSQQVINAGHVVAAEKGGLATEDNLALICAGRLSQYTHQLGCDNSHTDCVGRLQPNDGHEEHDCMVARFPQACLVGDPFHDARDMRAV